MSKLKTILIGCGAISKKHIDGCLKNAADIELAAVCDIVEKKEQKTAKHYKKVLKTATEISQSFKPINGRL